MSLIYAEDSEVLCYQNIISVKRDLKVRWIFRVRTTEKGQQCPARKMVGVYDFR